MFHFQYLFYVGYDIKRMRGLDKMHFLYQQWITCVIIHQNQLDTLH